MSNILEHADRVTIVVEYNKGVEIHCGVEVNCYYYLGR